MSEYFPPYIRSSGPEEIKVDLNLTNYDTSSFALKTNLNTLKTKLVPKLVTVPVDLANLSNKVQSNQTKNETELSSLKTKVQNSNSTTNNLKTNVDGIDSTKYVKKTDYDTKIGNLELKIPGVGGKLNTLDFNSKISALENKIKTAESNPNISNLANKTELKNVEKKIPSTDAFVEKTDYTTEISSIKNDYVTNASLNSQLNNSKSQYIADEVKKVDDKVSKNSTGILGFESRLKQKKDILDDVQREASFNRRNYYYNQQY